MFTWEMVVAFSNRIEMSCPVEFENHFPFPPAFPPGRAGFENAFYGKMACLTIRK